MGINKENYEAYFLDYQEGTLATEQVAELMVFLEVYPELKEELEVFELVSVEPDDTVKLGSKNFLKKTDYVSTKNINSNNYEEWLVADVEGDLNLQDKVELKAFIDKNPAARLELNIFRKTVLKPEPIKLENKQSLKKRGLFLLYSKEIIYTVSIAASILLFFGIYFFGDFIPNTRLADTDWNLDLQSKQISKLNISNIELKQIQLKNRTAISPTIDVAQIENKIVLSVNDNISQIAAIRYTTSLLVEEFDIYYISYKYDASFAMFEGEPEVLPEPKKKSFVGRFFSSSIAKLIPSRNPSGKSLFEYSVDGYNLLADREVEVEKQYNTDGRVVYNVNGEVINFSRKVKSTPQN